MAEPSRCSEDADQPDQLCAFQYNQDGSCMAIGTNHGYCVASCDVFMSNTHRAFPGGVAYIAMFNTTNILAIVPFRPDRLGPSDTVLLWDDLTNQCVMQQRMKRRIRGVEMRGQELMVLQDDCIDVFERRPRDLVLLYHSETALNFRGIHAWALEQNVLAFPNVVTGRLTLRCRVSSPTALDEERVVDAHVHALTCMALSYDGQLLATASTVGTLIRVFNTANGTLLREFRRGVDSAEVYSLAFNDTNDWLACSTSVGVVCLFSLDHRVQHGQSSSSQSTVTGSSAAGSSSDTLAVAVATASAAGNYLWSAVSSAWTHIQKSIPKAIVPAEWPTCHIMLHEPASWWSTLPAMPSLPALPMFSRMSVRSAESTPPPSAPGRPSAPNSPSKVNKLNKTVDVGMAPFSMVRFGLRVNCMEIKDVSASASFHRPSSAPSSAASRDVLYIATSDASFYRLPIAAKPEPLINLSGPTRSFYDLLRQGPGILHAPQASCNVYDSTSSLP